MLVKKRKMVQRRQMKDDLCSLKIVDFPCINVSRVPERFFSFTQRGVRAARLTRAANVKPKLKDKVSTLLFFGHFNFSRNLQPALNENVGSEKLFLCWLGFVIVRRFQEELYIYVPY